MQSFPEWGCNMDEKKKREYFCLTFLNDTGMAVLEELEDFARFNDGQFIPDPRLEAYMQGRRSVICEINKIMKGKEN